MPKCAIGIDFGTESGRALVVEATSGRVLGSAVHGYADGTVAARLPGTSIRLEPDWALQNPHDYLETLRRAVPEAVKQAGVRAEDIVGIGVDFTSCTILPTDSDGRPLCELPQWRGNPHAWVKLWKHHAAQPEANRICEVARMRNEPWLPRYGGVVSSEWYHSKTLEILNDAPEVFAAAARIVEAGDWIVWQMTGVLRRNACAAGYKGLWQREFGYPDNEFLCALDPRLDGLNDTKLAGEIVPPGTRVGGLCPAVAAWMGLAPGTPVAAATIDAHAAVPGVGVSEPGRMVLILGTSTCHMVLDRARHLVPGISGVVEDGILPGLFGYEAGQAGVGDLFAWFVAHGVGAAYERRAIEHGLTSYDLLEREAAELEPGESGLLALDWWNGCRTPLVDASLSGLLVGATLQTRAADIYRALIEATAFGTRVIVDTFAAHGVAVKELVACGGLAERNKLLLRIYADVTGRELVEAGSGHASALGAAMFGAAAAGAETSGVPTIAAAAERMSGSTRVVHRPHARHRATYDRLFADYRALHEYFGRGGNGVMQRLRALRAAR
ncbi:ribulokinase [Candidatus Binatia bacterium]|nr:ribulokinase [Candidatus Binatia bacterium]